MVSVYCRSHGHRHAEQVLTTTKAFLPLGVGFAVEWRKGSQGQCALQTGKGELGRLLV